MPDTSPVRQLADEFTDRLFEAEPLEGDELGLREYAGRLGDVSAAAQAAFAEDAARIAARADDLEPATDADRVTLGAIRSWATRTLLDEANHSLEHTVTAMPFSGPAVLFAVAARTVLVDSQAADDYLDRLLAGPAWIDAHTGRLREGHAKGRLPVASLVEQAIGFADTALAQDVPPGFLTPQPPEGWDGADAWRDRVADAVRDGIKPALGRWRELLQELLPEARSDEQAGLVALPGGADDYVRSIAVHTTLPLTADELHQTGLSTIERLNERALELGSRIGLNSMAEIAAASRAASRDTDPTAALHAARAAVARAEARAHELMPAPLPPACAVEPMPDSVADAGMAPHYTYPRPDGSRPGTYWFNTRRPTAGTGWDLESVAFHETVPGHHSQLARIQVLESLPMLQRLSITVHSEGWGLYAERLASEIGLYSDERAELGAIFTELFRAARLVVDTGLHAFGWSRQRAVQFMVDNVPVPESFLANEVDRYIVYPGQALAYLTGQREIFRLRDAAKATMGGRFDLPGFHAAVLDSGSLPMPVLADVVHAWARG